MLRTMQENKQEKSPYNDSLTYCTTKLADDPNVGKPYYDVDFIGGFTEIFNSQVSAVSYTHLAEYLQYARSEY